MTNRLKLLVAEVAALFFEPLPTKYFYIINQKFIRI